MDSPLRDTASRAEDVIRVVTVAASEDIVGETPNEGLAIESLGNKDSADEELNDNDSPDEELNDDDSAGEELSDNDLADTDYSLGGSDDQDACECGYISDAESYDEDYDYEGDSDSSEEDYGNLSRSFRHYVGCAAKQAFRLKDLPQEIRLMIFRFAMPDDRTLPLHAPAHDWNDRYDSHYSGYEGFSKLLKRPEVIPRSLFRIESISSEALSVFDNEVYFRMDISPFGIRVRGARTGALEEFDNHQRLAQWYVYIEAQCSSLAPLLCSQFMLMSKHSPFVA